jgi:hypothetical protein
VEASGASGAVAKAAAQAVPTRPAPEPPTATNAPAGRSAGVAAALSLEEVCAATMRKVPSPSNPPRYWNSGRANQDAS